MGKNMRLLATAAIAAICAAGPASANDFPQCFDKSILAFVDCPGYSDFHYDWSGYYIGAHAGYGSLDLSGGYDTDGGAAAVFGQDIEPDGFAGGGQIGVNFQSDFYVLGLEVDASVAEMDAQISRSGGGDTNAVEATINGFGSIRARAGVAMEEFLPYVTAGVGLVSYEIEVNDIGDGVATEEEDSAIVGVIGGGLEIGLTEEFTIRGEGLYYYIDEDVSFTEPGDAPENITLEDLWTLRGAINWRF